MFVRADGSQMDSKQFAMDYAIAKSDGDNILTSYNINPATMQPIDPSRTADFTAAANALKAFSSGISSRNCVK
jgi:hypothetical protein